MPDHRRAHGSADVTETQLVGGSEKRDIVIRDYDPGWPDAYATHEARIMSALGRAAHQVEHVGSTSVPGLAAKPIIDILVTVHDITAEQGYGQSLLDAGYQLRVRESGHRMFRTPDLDVHVHVYEVDDPAGEDLLLLRGRLRGDDADRLLYERTKRELAQHDWPDMEAYADAKTEVLASILTRARSDPGGRCDDAAAASVSGRSCPHLGEKPGA